MTRLNIPLFVALAASILSAVPADAGRDTLPHQRMIRKRTPPIIGRVEAFDHGIYVRQADPTGSLSTGAGSSAASSTATSASRATSASASATATSASESATSAASSTVASTSSGGLLDSLTNLLSTSSTVASTSATSTAISTSTAASSTTPQTSSTPSSTPQAPATSNTVTPSLNIASAAPSTDRAGSTLIVTQTAISPEASASASAAAKKKTQTITRNTIISLVVIASCIGGAIAIWTVIRKWKLSPSERFDDRMQPIDWAPQPAGGAADETIEEKRHRRAGSTGSHGSFTSGGVGKSETGHGAYNDSQHGHGYGMQSQDFPPAHDFTAGAAQPGYGQYYGGQQYAGGAPGYADLQRGPSMSESTYSHGASVSRGLSYSRGPTAGYDAQPGAAGVPPLPNPYGGEYGYDDYGHTGQPAGQPQQPQGQGQYRGY